MRVAVIIIIALTSVVYGQKVKPHPNTDKGNSATEHGNPPNTAGQTVIVVNQQAPQGQQDDHSGKAVRYLRELLVPANAPNLALVLVGIGGIIAAICSLRKIDGQIAEMKDQRKEMGNQVRAAILQVQTMQTQITEMSVQSDILRGSVKAARDAADAAKQSADIAARISIPTLKIEKFGFGYTGAATMAAILQFPNVEMVIKNYGRTPAFLRSWTIVFTCEALPDLPTYGNHPGSGIVLEKEVIKPGESYTLPQLDRFRRQNFSDDDIQAILNREKVFVAYGYVCYGDLFGNPLKRHKFCELILNIGDNWAQWTEVFSDPPYIGTDDFPMKKTGYGQKVVAESENNPEKAT
ncbi:MAG TPA: hypothetical protein VFA74_09560 [Terriglobales bacterium]|nr:hypothetical protein [Terriglobales bacterium]